jgi:hypothetical protein
MNIPDIDPVKYGILWQKVEDYERRFDEMSAKIDKMESSIEKLIAMANQSKGGFWMGMTLVSIFSSFVGYAFHWFNRS